MVTMRGVICERSPALHAMTEEVPVPITEGNQQLDEDMLTFLKDSQDPIKTKGLQLRGGVSSVTPQLGISKRVIVVHAPSNDPENETPSLDTVIYSPRILSHSVQDVCLDERGGCLSVGQDVPGYVIRHNKATVSHLNMSGEKHKVRLKSCGVVAVQHRIDHINGIMFYDHISKENPFALKKGVSVIG